MDCTPPATWAEIAEWRADTGYPADAYAALVSLGEAIFDGAPDCPTMNTDYSPWTFEGGCTSANGYELELTGEMSGGWYRLSATIVPGSAADGTWPTGTLDLEVDQTTSGTGTYGGTTTDLVATWDFDDAGTTGLPLTGTLDGRDREGWNGCGADGTGSMTGDLEGCAFDVAWESSSYVGNDGNFEGWTFTFGTSSAEVTYGVCGTRLGVWDGARSRLDETWAELPFTDLDGDGCAAEDCDCDESDAAVYPGADDPRADGLDLDCDGSDDPDGDECSHTFDPCAPATDPEDTGDTGDSGAEPACTAPATFADAAAWRADGTRLPGLEEDLLRLGEALLEGAEAGCPVVDESAVPFVWTGGCALPSGYALSLDGTSWSGGDYYYSEGGYAFAFTLVATDAADGTLPTGTFSLEVTNSAYYDASSQSLVAAWSLDEPGPTALPVTGTLSAEAGGSSGTGCGGETRSYAGELDGCPFASSHATSAYTGEPDVRERHTVTVGDWSGDVRLRECGTREGLAPGLRERLDADWAALPFIDLDGDACAAEDCDCDDFDATIHPSAEDPVGDGLDRDCNGDDAAYPDDCPTVWTECAASAVLGPPDTGDTGAPDDTDEPAPVDPPAASDPSDEGCGCGSTPAAPGGLLLAFAALLRRRRRGR